MSKNKQKVEDVNNDEIVLNGQNENVETAENCCENEEINECSSCAKTNIGYVNCEQLNVRKAPSKDSLVLMIINRGTKVFIEDIVEDSLGQKWVKITFEIKGQEDIIGYVVADLISI